MPNWFEVFDNEQVQLLTRRQAAKLTGICVGIFACSVVLFALGHLSRLPLSVAFFLVGVGWIGSVAWLLNRFKQLHKIVWCVKISSRFVAGYDYARRKTALDWTVVERVELDQEGLTVVGPSLNYLQIPHLFTDFATLSHRIVQYAEFYEIPVLINGQLWEEIDVYSLFPFLTDNPSSP